MPLLATVAASGPSTSGPTRSVSIARPARLTSATWHAPDGGVWPLTDGANVLTKPGWTGLEAAPREVNRQAVPTGGGYARRSYAGERLVSWPVEVFCDGDPDGFITYWRAFVHAFTQTTPPAGVPTTGRLRVTRADGTWRELSCLYLDGLGGDDDSGAGYTWRHAVLSLVAPDPWWYGPTVRAATWEYVEGRSYLVPYETVSPGLHLGESQLTIASDVDVEPVWTIRGPLSGITARRSDGVQWTLNVALGTGQTRVVDVPAAQVVDGDGAPRWGELALPDSELFTLPPGRQALTINIDDAAPGTRVDMTYQPRSESA